MVVRGSCARRCGVSEAISSPDVAAAFVDVADDVGGAVSVFWQAAIATSERASASRFMAGILCLVCAMFASVRDHRVHELSRALSIRRRPVRAEAVEENQMRKVCDGLRDPQPGVLAKED